MAIIQQKINMKGFAQKFRYVKRIWHTIISININRNKTVFFEIFYITCKEMEEVKNLQGNIFIILSYILFLLYLFFPWAHNPATTQY